MIRLAAAIVGEVGDAGVFVRLSWSGLVDHELGRESLR